jgi:hypothetical protein
MIFNVNEERRLCLQVNTGKSSHVRASEAIGGIMRAIMRIADPTGIKLRINVLKKSI